METWRDYATAFARVNALKEAIDEIVEELGADVPSILFLGVSVEELSNKIKPQLILVSAGFDAHRQDPIGSLGLEVEDFITLTKTVKEIAAAHSGGQLVSVLEGGYNLDVIPDCVDVHLQELLAK